MNLVESNFVMDEEAVEERPRDWSPSFVDKIEECWKPHEFRDVIKKAKNAFKAKEYLTLIMIRIDFVNEFKAKLDCQETLQEIREEIADYITANNFERIKSRNLFVPEKAVKDHAYISGQKSKNDPAPKKEKTQLLTDNRAFIEKELTLQVFAETKRDKSETARRLGISRGRLMHRLINYGAYP